MDDDISLEEKRLYRDRRDRTIAYVASALGVTRVALAGDQIGRFSLVRREPATAIAGSDGRLVVATEADVLVASGDSLVPTDFGPATVVSIADGRPVAVDPEGKVARLVEDDWETVGTVDGPRRADGELLATAEGVYRLDEELTPLGGEDVRDVAASGPYAASARGIFRYDGEWLRETDGDCSLIAATDGRAHAVGEDGFLQRNGDWQAMERPTEAPLADVVHGEGLYAVTADGTVLVHARPELTPDGQGGWRSRELGVRQVRGLAVP